MIITTGAMTAAEIIQEEDNMKRLVLFTFISLFLLIAEGYSQTLLDIQRLGTGFSGVSARAAGLGNSYTAISDDGAGMFYNPAGIGLIRKFEFSGGFNYNNIGNTADFLGKSTEYSNSSTKIDNFAFVIPFPTVRGSLVFGVGYNNITDFNYALKFSGFNNGSTSMIQDMNVYSEIPYELYLTDDNYNTQIAGRLNQSGSTLNSGSLGLWTFSGSIEAAQDLFLGASLGFINGSFAGSREYYEDDLQGVYKNVELAPGYAFTKDFRTFYLNQLLNWDIGGYDLKIGMLYKLKNFARVGVTIQFPRTVSIKETYSVNAYTDWGDGTRKEIATEDYTYKSEYDIIQPYKMTAGASANFKGLIASAEVTLTDYTQTKMENTKGIQAGDVAALNKDIKDYMRAVLDYNFGVEYTIPDPGFRIRAGFMTQKSAYKGDGSDYDRKYVTGGFGFLVDNSVSFDVAYVRGFWNDYGDNYGSGVSRYFQSVTTDKVILSFGYRF